MKKKHRRNLIVVVLSVIAIALAALSLLPMVPVVELEFAPVFSFYPTNSEEVLMATQGCVTSSVEIRAAIYGNPDICDIHDDPEMAGECRDISYFYSTVYGNDLCGSISDQDTRTLCSAVRDRDLRTCSSVGSLLLRSTCQGIVSLDSSHCSSLSGQEREACENNVLMFNAMESGNPDMCTRATDYPADEEGEQEIFCRVFVTKNPMITSGSSDCNIGMESISFSRLDSQSSCSVIQDPDGLLYCEAMASQDPSKCSSLASGSLKYRCYYETVGLEEFERICQADHSLCTNPDS